MIQMHGTPDRARIYGDIADRMERDPISEDLGRATVPMGRGFKWARFNREADLVWVSDIDGRMVALTPKQALVYKEMRLHFDTGTVSFRALATRLNLSPSTVSRAAVKLASFGLIAYLTGRGRYAGTLIVKRVSTSDGLERFRTVAKAKLRQFREAAERRLSRLQSNVAPYALEKERGVDSLYYYLTSVSITKGATLKAAWTADDLAGIV